MARGRTIIGPSQTGKLVPVGVLGEFGQGQMVPEFDAVIFSAEVGKTHGPVQTQFGYHLIEITSRTE